MAKRSPKLLFTDEERNTPELKRAVKKADKSIAKLEKAEANIPKKRIKKKQRFIDENSGKVKTKIMFEEVDKKKPSSQLKSEVRTAPAQFAAGAAVNILRDNEDDSAATNITHSVEKTADTSIRAAQFANRSSKLKPYKNAERAEKQADKANITHLTNRLNISRVKTPALILNPNVSRKKPLKRNMQKPNKAEQQQRKRQRLQKKRPKRPQILQKRLLNLWGIIKRHLQLSAVLLPLSL